MDQRIFDQLARLERGARVDTRPAQYAYDDNSAEFSAHEGHGAGYEGYPRNERQENHAFADHVMATDRFGGYSMQQSDYGYGDDRGDLGREIQHPTRPVNPSVYRPRNEYARDVGLPANSPSFATQRFDPSRFALNHDYPSESSSSPSRPPRHSSPAFSASQRRPRPYEYPGSNHPLIPRSVAPRVEQPSAYEPLGVEDLQAEEMTMHPPPRPAPAGDNQSSYSAQSHLSIPRQVVSTTPVVQGISLVSTRTLPDRFRAVFPYPLFNAIQSKSFETIYNSNYNFVLSAPTGSGKTAVLELAICRLVTGFAAGSYKIVYQAPTKSLCSERQRDWEAKFAPLDLKCAELTGDTNAAQLRNVQHASIIITTPEKWDSVTRKWKDHRKLTQMVKLFLIDEVHILKEDRGATLEAVVSRMKSVGSDVRFVALSATVPNSDDIATWLGKDPTNTHLPASRERFGEEFRPVRLQRHVRGYQGNLNDFAFEKTLDGKLPEVVAKWSQKKPIMVFCFTRKACVDTAKFLTNWWATKEPRERYWSAPRKRIIVADKDLRNTVSSGVAFHHAGLSAEDRAAIEKGFLEADINVICCTSTLAVGVNLPCHMVIIKNTVTYQSNIVGCKEYSDLEIMQMLGRAGRPQFDDSAVAVIMTRTNLVSHYEKMITGQEVLESRLHYNLIDHLNAEIGLGTVTDASSAKKWLSGTFLHVRLNENPDHYKIEGDAPGRSLDERLENICKRGIASLEKHDLIRSTSKLHCTEFGDAMARYYLQFDTMKVFLDLAPKAKMSEILSAVSNAAEFNNIRFRAGEKNIYKNLNKNSSIKFPIPGELSSPAHKVSLIIQAVLGAVDLPTEDQKQQWEYQTSKTAIFQHAHRLVRCIIDCQLYLEDSISTRNALMLARSLGAQVWDDSPLHMKQLEGVGIVSVRKLVAAGISTIEDLGTTEPYRLEQTLSRNPPYGLQIQDKARAFPKLRISMRMMGEPVVKKGEHVIVKIKAELGFLNDKIPETFQKRAVYVCLLVETSDGHKVHFARISAKKLSKGQDMLFSANLTSASQSIRAYVMCDEIAGTMRHVVLKPLIPSAAFPPIKAMDYPALATAPLTSTTNTSKRKASQVHDLSASTDTNEFGDDGLDDADLARAESDGFVDIDDFEDNDELRREPSKKKQKTKSNAVDNDDWEPQQLSNGKWSCRHACGDKSSCRHLCCREGLDKKPKQPKPKDTKKATDSGSDPMQMQLTMPTTKNPRSTAPAKTLTAKSDPKFQRKAAESKEARDLNSLHNSVPTKTKDVPKLGREQVNDNTDRNVAIASHENLSLPDATPQAAQTSTSDYGMIDSEIVDLSEIEAIGGTKSASRMSPPRKSADMNFDFGVFDRTDEDLELTEYADEFNGNTERMDGLTRDHHHDVEEGRQQQPNAAANMFKRQNTSHSGQRNIVDPGKKKPILTSHSTSDTTSDELPTEYNSVKGNNDQSKRDEADAIPLSSRPRPAEQKGTRVSSRSEENSHGAISDGGTELLMHNDAVAKDIEGIKEDVESEDSVEKLVMGLLGTKDFNYIG